MQIDIHAKTRAPAKGETTKVVTAAAAAPAASSGPCADIPPWEPRAQAAPFVKEYTPYSPGPTNIEATQKAMVEKK